jgi:hypothetical protein
MLSWFYFLGFIVAFALANKKYLLLFFPDESTIAQKMLAVASSIVFANLTERSLILPQKLPFYSNSNTYEPLFNATVKLTDSLEAFRYFTCPNATVNTNNLGWWIDDVVQLTTNDYFLPALYLNPEYRTKLEKLYPDYNPFEIIFEQHFKFDPLFTSYIEGRHQMVTEYFGSDKNIIGMVLEDSNSYYGDSKLGLKCLRNSSNFEEDIVHAIATLPQYSQFLQEHIPHLLFQEKSNLQNDLSILADIFFQAKYATKLILYPNSPISQIIHALSPKAPAIYLRNALGSECVEATSHPEPCFKHSLKQYFQLCGEKLGIEFNPHDPISRPLFIDTCKDAKIGIQIVNPTVEDELQPKS